MAQLEHIGRIAVAERLIHAPAAQVYEAWAKAERIAKWFVDDAKNDMEPGATITWVFEAMGMQLPLEVYEAIHGQRLAFGCDMPPRPKALQIVEVEAADDSSCRLRLENSGFQDGPEWDDEFQGVVSGWIMALAQLEHWLTQYDDGGAREHLFAMLPCQYEYADLLPYYTTREGLEAWLAARAEFKRGDRAHSSETPTSNEQSGDALAVGDHVRLELREGPSLDGQVLAQSERELMLSWPELRATLTLKCFSMGPLGRAIALDFNSWGAAGSREAAKLVMDQALPRLAARLG